MGKEERRGREQEQFFHQVAVRIATLGGAMSPEGEKFPGVVEAYRTIVRRVVERGGEWGVTDKELSLRVGTIELLIVSPDRPQKPPLFILLEAEKHACYISGHFLTGLGQVANTHELNFELRKPDATESIFLQIRKDGYLVVVS